jgi:hypothetical protein
MGNKCQSLMLNNSVPNTETGGCAVTDTSVPLFTTAVAATQKPRYTVNGLTGGCDNITMLNFMFCSPCIFYYTNSDVAFSQTKAVL